MTQQDTLAFLRAQGVPFELIEHPAVMNMQEVEALPDEERRIVKLFYYDNKKTSDIARAMHLTEANVLVRLHRIRLRIKKRINDNDNE